MLCGGLRLSGATSINTQLSESRLFFAFHFSFLVLLSAVRSFFPAHDPSSRHIVGRTCASDAKSKPFSCFPFFSRHIAFRSSIFLLNVKGSGAFHWLMNPTQSKLFSYFRLSLFFSLRLLCAPFSRLSRNLFGFPSRSLVHVAGSQQGIGRLVHLMQLNPVPQPCDARISCAYCRCTASWANRRKRLTATDGASPSDRMLRLTWHGR